MEGLKITDFLQRGSAVKTQLSNSISWVANVVFDTYSNKNEVGVIFDDRYSNSVILVGDEIKLNSVDGDVQYFMETVVTSIRLEAVRIMTLRIESIKKIPNLRKYERYSVNYGATICSFDSPFGVFGVVTNISLSGIGFISKENLLVGECINISIMLPSSSFIIDAEIVRANDTIKGTEYGARFLYDDSESKEELIKLIEDIKEREDRLSRIMGVDV